MGGIWTGGGDRGETSLGDGSRVAKDDRRVEAYGTLDEAAAAIGLARVHADDAPLDLLLAFAQQRLLNLAALLASPGDPRVPAPSADDVASLERATDDLMHLAGDLRGFTLPGGNELGARLHVARTVVRRAERRLVTLASAEEVDPSALRFVNRLSDALYAAARFANAKTGDEESWDAGFPAPER
ncbi:MAG TPA: cob(I)yrinic acid a,c-diamide adenosyltransferase [Coriobacteriia bacterium]